MLAPFMSSSLSSRSHHSLLSQACTKGFFSISSFSSLPWVTAEISLSPLLLVHVPSPTGHHFQLHPCSLFPFLLVHFSPQCIMSLPDLYKLSLCLASISSLSSPQAPLLFSSRNVKSSAVTLKWLKPTLVPKEILCLPLTSATCAAAQ